MQKTAREFNDYLNNRVSPKEGDELKAIREKHMADFLENKFSKLSFFKIFIKKN